MTQTNETIDAKSSSLDDIAGAIIQAENANWGNLCEARAYKYALRQVRETLIPKMAQKLSNKGFEYHFSCTPGLYGISSLDLSRAGQELKVFLQFHDTFGRNSRGDEYGYVNKQLENAEHQIRSVFA